MIFVTFCANDSWCFPVSLLARIQIDIAELAVLQKKTKEGFEQKAAKDTKTDQELCFRYDLGPLLLPTLLKLQRGMNSAARSTRFQGIVILCDLCDLLCK